MVRMWRYHCRGLGSILVGELDPTSCAVRCGQEEKKKKKRKKGFMIISDLEYLRSTEI